MQVSEPGKKSVLHSLESWGSTEEMLGVFQNTLLKWFGEEACLIRETQTTVSHFLRDGERGRTPAVWKQPKVGFCCLLCLVTPWRCHTTAATGSVIGNLPTPCGGSFIYLPSASKLAAGITWRRFQWGQLVAEILPCLQGWERLV